MENLQELERESNHLRSKLHELEHAHETLLLIHGEASEKMEELEQQNADIKDLCRQQTLLLSQN